MINVFDLPGPQFLLFYVVFAGIIGGALYLALSLPIGADGSQPLISDPYRIACLRGGLLEAARLAIVSLADRRLVDLPHLGVVAPGDDPAPPGLHPVERAVLANCRRPQGKVIAVVRSPPVRAACRDVRESLVEMGLAPGEPAKLGRAALCLLAGGLVVGVGVAKLFIAEDRGRHNIGFLVVGIITATVFFLVMALPPPRTRRGAAMLADLRRLLDGRKAANRSNAPTSDALFLAAVYGAAGLSEFDDLRALSGGQRGRPRRAIPAGAVAPRAAAAAAAAVDAAAVAAAEPTARTADRFGLGWRPELAEGILANLDAIDLIEIIADDHFSASRAELKAWRRLASRRPIVWHGVSLGLASTVPVDPHRLDAMARLVGETGAAGWSEHLAFVRGGGVEIGHLAAPPRSVAAIDGACANLARARQIVGSAPAVENVATLVEPPASELPEPEWTRRIVEAAAAPLLLDLHNLYANAVNFGCEPFAYLRHFPLDRVTAVHLAGGRWLDGPNGVRRLLDDHLHDVPQEVFALLAELGRLAPRPLDVVIERDGRYPEFSVLLDQLQAARQALATGRAAAR